MKISLCLLAAGLLTKREKAVYSFQMHHCIHSGGVQYGGAGVVLHLAQSIFISHLHKVLLGVFSSLSNALNIAAHIRACDICTTGGSVLCH